MARLYIDLIRLNAHGHFASFAFADEWNSFEGAVKGHNMVNETIRSRPISTDFLAMNE